MLIIVFDCVWQKIQYQFVFEELVAAVICNISFGYLTIY